MGTRGFTRCFSAWGFRSSTLLLKLTAGLLGASLCGAALANPVLLDSTTINFWASGNPNSISGSWTASPLSIADGASIEYFSFQLSAIDSPWGKPASITFVSYVPGNSNSLDLCSFAQNCATDTVVGDVGTLAPGSLTSGWSFLSRLVAGNEPADTIHTTIISYNGGGAQGVASGSLLVQAYGTAPAMIPEPSTWGMLIAGLGLVGVAARRRRD